MFWLLAATLLLIALAFLLPPLLHGGDGDTAVRSKRDAVLQAQRVGVLSDEEARVKLAALDRTAPTKLPASRLLPIALAILLPVSAIGLYRQIGEPRAFDPIWQGAVAAASGSRSPQAAAPADAAAPDMEKAVTGLAERLKQQPDDLEGWMLLGRAYKSMERFAPAREALANAFRLAPNDPDVMVEYAEAQVLASDSRRFEGESRQLLARALKLQPESQRGLWLLGIAAYQANDFAEAASVWERLLAALPADAEPRASLVERIADARQRAGLEPLPPQATAPMASPDVAAAEPTANSPTPMSASTPNPSTPASAGPSLTVTVDIAPDLKSKVGASDVLFVFARAAQGPRMPLAIHRLPAGSLPVTVTLDDSTSMMPSMKLSTIPQVVVGARISKSGQATPQPGDFEALSDPIANTHAAPLKLVITKVLP